MEAYKVYWTNCVKGIHKGQMVLHLVEAIGKIPICIRINSPPDVPAESDPSKPLLYLECFAMKERPKWMKISSLDELKSKAGHVIVMILLVKMFQRSKMVTIATGLDFVWVAKRPPGYGFLDFEDSRDARDAIRKNGWRVEQSHNRGGGGCRGGGRGGGDGGRGRGGSDFKCYEQCRS
ncbi:unnamed protein product [Brassica oleracea]